jgi:hypothetical protein
MFKKLHIKNYRNFDDVQFFKLKQLNVLTGKNGGGKTTVLEAIFLNCSGAAPQMALSINGFRGQNAAHPLIDTPFRSLFRDQDPSNVIEISADEAKNLKSHERFLRLEAIVSERTVPGRSRSDKFVSGMVATFSGQKSKRLKAKFSWRIDSAIYSKLNASNQPQLIKEDLFDVEQPPQPDLVHARFLSPYLPNLRQETAGQLVEAIKRRSLDSVLSVLRILDPEVVDLAPLLEEGQQVIYVDTGQGDLKPLHVMGAGFIHLLSLALALDEIENGIILIDELENGLHYSIHSRVLGALLDVLKRKPNVQVFATTHSSELIRTLSECVQTSGYQDICLYNVSGRANRVTQFERHELLEAVESEFELR